MTQTVLKEIVHRAVSDAAFRRQLRTDPAQALAGISLTKDERSALTSGDPAKLTALGVDQRMSKVFSAGLLSEASKSVLDIDTQGANAVFTDDQTSGSNAALISDAATSSRAAFAEQGASHQRMIEQDLDASGKAAVIATDAPASHLQMLERDLDSGGAAVASDDTTTVVRSAETSSDAPTHLQMIERDLDTASVTQLEADTNVPSHLQMIEQDLDTGSATDTLGGDAQITEY